MVNPKMTVTIFEPRRIIGGPAYGKLGLAMRILSPKHLDKKEGLRA